MMGRQNGLKMTVVLSVISSFTNYGDVSFVLKVNTVKVTFLITMPLVDIIQPMSLLDRIR